jgi:hypothetical protein
MKAKGKATLCDLLDYQIFHTQQKQVKKNQMISVHIIVVHMSVMYI